MGGAGVGWGRGPVGRVDRPGGVFGLVACRKQISFLCVWLFEVGVRVSVYICGNISTTRQVKSSLYHTSAPAKQR